MNKKYIIAGGLVVLMFVTWMAFGMESSEEKVIYAQPKSGAFQVNIMSTGELQAQNSTSISAPENMRSFGVNSVPILTLVDEGTVVEKGEFVAELDRSSLSNTLQDAQLGLEEEQTQLDQAKLDSAITLSDARSNLEDLEYAIEEAELVVEQSQYESPSVQRQAEIDLERAKRQLRQSQENYEKQVQKAEANIRRRQNEVQEERNDVARIRDIMSQFTIQAPENGMVIYRRDRDGSKISEGDNISAWDPRVAELPDFSVMESITYINEVDIQKIISGQQVNVGLDAMPEKELTGQITSVANIGEQRPNSNSKVFQVTIRINESDSTLRPSMTTSNVININSADSALFVPLETIHSRDSVNVVFKKSGQQAVMQQVIMGMMNENDVVIEEGVNMNDQLYLSMPDDTTGLELQRLPQDIIDKYQQMSDSLEQESEEVEEQQNQRRKLQRRGSGNGRSGRN